MNEDVVSCDEQRGVFAIADGASESFDSGAWASLLVSHFIKDATPGPEWVDEARLTYDRSWDYGSLGWSEQMAFDRGSFATLLGCRWIEASGSLEIFAVGDSIAIQLEGRTLAQSYPYTTAREFDQRPQLLSTRAEANRFVRSESFRKDCSTVWHLSDGSRVLLMTDALGQWLLADPDGAGARLDLLVSADTESAFEELVLAQRLEGSLRVDDTTLLVLAVRS